MFLPTRNDIHSVSRSIPGLISRADRKLSEALVSVTDKEMLPPGGDRRDYLSIGTYYHPAGPGEPWVRRDGVRNPDIGRYDRIRLETAVENSVTLILAYASTGEEKYALCAREVLNHFFLDLETGMNPHLSYAQFIPGVCDGRGIGIIDTYKLLFLADVAEHLPYGREVEALQRWFAVYLEWLLNSNNGRAECAEHNNHGTWYDAQTAGFAALAGREGVARERIGSSLARIDSQITPDGRMPHEEVRTLSLSYSTLNLLGFTMIRNLARHLGCPFDDSRPEASYRYLTPYWERPESWPHQQISPFNRRGADAIRALRGDAPAYLFYAYIFSEEI